MTAQKMSPAKRALSIGSLVTCLTLIAVDYFPRFEIPLMLASLAGAGVFWWAYRRTRREPSPPALPDAQRRKRLVLMVAGLWGGFAIGFIMTWPRVSHFGTAGIIFVVTATLLFVIGFTWHYIHKFGRRT